jgi:hypothetical protein
MDGSDIPQLQAEMVRCCDELVAGASALAQARQILAHDSDMRKNILATSTAPLLEECSATAAEIKARACPEYRQALDAWRGQVLQAEKHVTRNRALENKLDALRSLLSLAKTQTGAL